MIRTPATHTIELQQGYTPVEAQILMLHHLALAAAFFELIPDVHIAPKFDNMPGGIAGSLWLKTIKEEYKKLDDSHG